MKTVLAFPRDLLDVSGEPSSPCSFSYSSSSSYHNHFFRIKITDSWTIYRVIHKVPMFTPQYEYLKYKNLKIFLSLFKIGILRKADVQTQIMLLNLSLII